MVVCRGGAASLASNDDIVYGFGFILVGCAQTGNAQEKLSNPVCTAFGSVLEKNYTPDLINKAIRHNTTHVKQPMNKTNKLHLVLINSHFMFFPNC